MELQIEAGKTYKLKYPNGHGLKKIHIDYILDNPTNKENKLSNTLIIYRSWSKIRQGWIYYAEPYYVLAIYNDWEY